MGVRCGAGDVMQGSFDDVITFSTQLGACECIQPLSMEHSRLDSCFSVICVLFFSLFLTFSFHHTTPTSYESGHPPPIRPTRTPIACHTATATASTVYCLLLSTLLQSTFRGPRMGISRSTARYPAPASFLYGFAAQQCGMLSSPNMKNVRDANPAAFSPQP